MSKARIKVSTPATATMFDRYLFQSWVRASEGGATAARFPNLAPGLEAEPWMGIRCMRWFEADAGVRMSKIRRCESEVTDEMILGLWGAKTAEYVQECVGRVRTESGLS